MIMLLILRVRPDRTGQTLSFTPARCIGIGTGIDIGGCHSVYPIRFFSPARLPAVQALRPLTNYAAN